MLQAHRIWTYLIKAYTRLSQAHALGICGLQFHAQISMYAIKSIACAPDFFAQQNIQNHQMYSYPVLRKEQGTPHLYNREKMPPFSDNFPLS